MTFNDITDCSQIDLQDFRDSFISLTSAIRNLNAILHGDAMMSMSTTKPQEREIDKLRSFTILFLTLHFSPDMKIIDALSEVNIHMQIWQWEPTIKWKVVQNAVGQKQMDELKTFFDNAVQSFKSMIAFHDYFTVKTKK